MRMCAVSIHVLYNVMVRRIKSHEFIRIGTTLGPKDAKEQPTRYGVHAWCPSFDVIKYMWACFVADDKSIVPLNCIFLPRASRAWCCCCCKSIFAFDLDRTSISPQHNDHVWLGVSEVLSCLRIFQRARDLITHVERCWV